MPARIAIIPARGGSLGIKNKNIHTLLRKPLLQYTVDAAIDADLFDGIYVSSDSDKILDFAANLGAIPWRRPAAIARDDSPISEALAHLLESLKLHDRDIVALLQPTSPLRQSRHVKEAIQLHEKRGLPVISINSEPVYPSKYIELLPDNTVACRGDPAAPRQSLKPSFKPNGAIYIFTPLQFRQHSDVPVEGALAYPMSPMASLDIDTGNDLKLASVFLENIDVLDL